MLMMMTNLEAARQIAAYYHCLLSKEAMHAFADILVSRKYRKGERILDEGDVCRGMLYIEKGMTRQFYFKYDKDLTEHRLRRRNDHVSGKFVETGATRLMIEALEPTIGWEINKLEMDALASKSTEIALLYRKIFEF